MVASSKQLSVNKITDELLDLSNRIHELGKFPKDYSAEEFAQDLRNYATRLRNAHYMEKLNEHRKFLEEESHNVGDLEDWYINSVYPSDATPVWKKAHLEELVQDFWLIAKPMDERFENEK